MLQRYFWQWPIPAEVRPRLVFAFLVAFISLNLLGRFAPPWLFLLVLGVTLVPLLIKPSRARAKHCALAGAALVVLLALFNFSRHSLADYLLLRSSLSG